MLLKELNFSDNDLTVVPKDAFSNLPGLNVLDLSWNDISDVKNGAFLGLSELSKLLLNDNKLTSLKPSVFYGLENLQTLHLNNNFLDSINNNVFSSLKSLRGLFLAMNNLVHIPACAFNGLVSVITIDVSRNQLTSISGGAFAMCGELQILYLHHNRLTSIAKETFWYLDNLWELDLSKNSLLVFDRELISNSRYLRDLNLFGNQLQCSCKQLTSIFWPGIANVCVSCIRDTEVNNTPSFLLSTQNMWSQWTDTYEDRSGILMRQRNCASCAEAPRPWCVDDLPSARLDQRCVSIRSRRIFPDASLNSSFKGCPSFSEARGKADILVARESCSAIFKADALKLETGYTCLRIALFIAILVIWGFFF